MLIAAGRGVTALQDLTNDVDLHSVSIQSQQGSAHDTCQFTLHDPLSTSSAQAEDDLVILDELDLAGWPSVNLLTNPSLESPYISGIAQGWGLDSAAPAGFTAYQNIAHHMSYAPGQTLLMLGVLVQPSTVLYGSSCQQLDCVNVANGTTINYAQTVTLPLDDTGAPIVNVPYCFSGWDYYTGQAVGGATLAFKVNWLSATGSYLSTSSITQALSGGAANTWQRAEVIAPPPATAAQAKLYFQIVTTSGSVAFTVYLDGLSFERCTFANVQGLAFPAPVENPTFGYHGVHNVADGWASNLTTGGSTSIVTPGYFAATAQGVTISNAPAGQSNQVIQAGVQINPRQTYTLTVVYQVTAALSGAGCGARFGLNYADTASHYLGSTPYDLLTAIPLNTWQTWTVRIGPFTNPMPATTATAQIFAGLDSGSTGTNSGTLILGSITITPDAATQQGNGVPVTAITAGVYPTPFVGPGQPGCYQDALTGVWYRQLRLFGGYIRRITDDYTAGPERNRLIEAVDYGVLLSEAPANLLIKQQADSAAIAQAVAYAKTQGAYLAGLDTTTYVQTIAQVDSFAVTWQSVRDVLDHIANQTVAGYWVDPYKYLHYAPALAVSAPFAVSTSPDYVSTFPFEQFTYVADSTQSITTEVVEGALQLSAGQTITFNGDGATTSFTLYSSNPVAQIDSLTVGGVGQTIGLTSVNTFAQGYTALLDPSGGVVTLQTPPPTGTNNVVCVFRYEAPVLLRAHNANAESKTGLGRKIHRHVQYDHITSQQSAIDRANADLAQLNQARPVGTLYLHSPPCPTATPIQPGMAIAVTHPAAGFAGTLFQIQKVTTTQVGPGVIERQCDIGFYDADIAVRLAKIQSQLATLTSDANGAVINDIQTASDGWAVTDAITASVANVGVWDGASTWNGGNVWT